MTHHPAPIQAVPLDAPGRHVPSTTCPCRPIQAVDMLEPGRVVVVHAGLVITHPLAEIRGLRERLARLEAVGAAPPTEPRGAQPIAGKGIKTGGVGYAPDTRAPLLMRVQVSRVPSRSEDPAR